MLTVLAMVAAAAVQVAATPAPPARAPAPVVERVVTVGDRTTRLSLFDNRTAVVTVREGGKQVLFRRRPMDEDEYVGYLAALTRDAPAAAAAAAEENGAEGGERAVITLHVGGGPARTIRYSPMQVAELPLAHLVAALDDLETTVEDTSPSSAALASWQPAVGDRVELWGGDTAVVTDVRDNGVIVLEHENMPLVEALAASERAARIRRVLHTKP